MYGSGGGIYMALNGRKRGGACLEGQSVGILPRPVSARSTRPIPPPPHHSVVDPETVLEGVLAVARVDGAYRDAVLLLQTRKVLLGDGL